MKYVKSLFQVRPEIYFRSIGTIEDATISKLFDPYFNTKYNRLQNAHFGLGDYDDHRVSRSFYDAVNLYILERNYLFYSKYEENSKKAESYGRYDDAQLYEIFKQDLSSISDKTKNNEYTKIRSQKLVERESKEDYLESNKELPSVFSQSFISGSNDPFSLMIETNSKYQYAFEYNDIWGNFLKGIGTFMEGVVQLLYGSIENLISQFLFNPNICLKGFKNTTEGINKILTGIQMATADTAEGILDCIKDGISASFTFYDDTKNNPVLETMWNLTFDLVAAYFTNKIAFKIANSPNINKHLKNAANFVLGEKTGVKILDGTTKANSLIDFKQGRNLGDNVIGSFPKLIGTIFKNKAESMFSLDDKYISAKTIRDETAKGIGKTLGNLVMSLFGVASPDNNNDSSQLTDNNSINSSITSLNGGFDYDSDSIRIKHLDRYNYQLAIEKESGLYLDPESLNNESTAVNYMHQVPENLIDDEYRKSQESLSIRMKIKGDPAPKTIYYYLKKEFLEPNDLVISKNGSTLFNKDIVFNYESSDGLHIILKEKPSILENKPVLLPKLEIPPTKMYATPKKSEPPCFWNPMPKQPVKPEPPCFFNPMPKKSEPPCFWNPMPKQPVKPEPPCFWKPMPSPKTQTPPKTSASDIRDTHLEKDDSNYWLQLQDLNEQLQSTRSGQFKDSAQFNNMAIKAQYGKSYGGIFGGGVSSYLNDILTNKEH